MPKFSKIVSGPIRNINNGKDAKPITHCCPEGCVLCCYGSFDRIYLTEGEYYRLKEYGAINLQKYDGQYVLKLPNTKCEFLVKGKCVIYEEDFRPISCKKFLCFDDNNLGARRE